MVSTQVIRQLDRGSRALWLSMLARRVYVAELAAVKRQRAAQPFLSRSSPAAPASLCHAWSTRGAKAAVSLATGGASRGQVPVRGVVAR